MKKLHHSRTMAIALASVCLCAGVARADDNAKKANDANAFQALAAPRPVAATKDKDDKQQQDAKKKQAAAKAAEEKAKKAKAAKKQAVAAPAAAAVPLNAAAQNDALLQQFQAQFRPALSAELAFIRHLCEVPKEKRPQVKAAGEAGLKEAAKQFVDMQQGRRRAANAASAAQPYPPKIIHDALLPALKEALPPEEFTRYIDETTKRAENRKHAAVLAFVSRLDGTLFLTAEQREEITASIAANWQDAWEQWLMAGYGDQYFPMIPDKAVVPHLTGEQKSVWNGLQKVAFGYSGGGWAVAEENDGWWGDEPEQAKAAAVNGVIFNGGVILRAN
ncbi:MAG: hypothetical protein HYX69_03705 [Planctomycetia bacterium]|nr:hypothetical protein [Planctomycetia bacterium]